MGRPPIVSAVVTTTAAERAAEDRRFRQDPDKIDELDKTNPFGQAIHHGGPYEAISRIVHKDVTSGWDERPPQSEVYQNFSHLSLNYLPSPSSDHWRTKSYHVR